MMEIIRYRLGWCPNAQSIRTAPAEFAPPAAMEIHARAGGGAGGPGRSGSGAGIAIGSIKILFRNMKLLGFSFLSGMVMLFSLAATISLQIISGANPFPGTMLFTEPGTIIIAEGSLEWVLLTFTTTLISTFLTIYLMAGLITYVSHLLSGDTMTILDALSRPGDHMRTLGGWAVIGTLMGTALAVIINSNRADLATIFISMGIMVIFSILTMFVVPAIVLSKENLVSAVLKSVSIFRKTIGEIVICAGILFLIVFVIYLVALIPIIMIGFSSASTAMAGVAVILSMLVMIILLFIGSTIVGIATLGLYMYGTTERLPGEFIR
jgi:hypothetical protein